MSQEGLTAAAIDWYADLQRIKKANGGRENAELDYLLVIAAVKLSSLGVNVEDLTLV